MSKAIQIQYMVRLIAFDLSKEKIEHFLNQPEIGGNGWELASVLETPDCPIFIFKRKRKEKGAGDE